MAKIYQNLTELIGNTPLLEIKNIEQAENLKARLFVKIEYFNPGGSVKDRVALSMINEAEKNGTLTPGATIIEPTSGNTGIGLAWVASVKGYKLILTMPETMSLERQNLLKALGATLVLTPGAEGMKGAIRKANELKEENAGAVILQQFDNPANPAIHEQTTAREIWEDTDGEIDIFVAGVGTGGTISGTASGLKRHNPAIVAVAVEPASSAVLSGGNPGPHKIQGIGAGFVPKNFNPNVVDSIVPVEDNDAIKASRMLAEKEGLLVGISSGAALYAALQLAKKDENEGKTIVALLPDTGERYLSTVLYAFDEYPMPALPGAGAGVPAEPGAVCPAPCGAAHSGDHPEHGPPAGGPAGPGTGPVRQQRAGRPVRHTGEVHGPGPRLRAGPEHCDGPAVPGQFRCTDLSALYRGLQVH